VSGEELLGRLVEQLERYDVQRSAAPVTSLRGTTGEFSVNSNVRARRVLLATGVEDSMPGDLEYLWPLVKRAQVRLCPVCDAFELCGKRIGVLSRGEHGLREARFLVNYTDQLWLVTHGAGHCSDAMRKRLASDNVQVVEGTLQQVVPAQAGVGLLFSDGEVLKLDALYVGFGARVRSALARDLGARCDESGYVEVDARQQSSVPGLYAAGDVVQSLSQISVAFGQAAIAASAINVSLNEERWRA
jgi:thioredoxin reductase (NADPH)